MTDRIIALVDSSSYAHSVCDHAAWAATRLGCAVEAIHVLGRREAPGRQDLSGTIALGARTALLEELAALDAERARLAHARGRAILDDAQGIFAAAGVASTGSLRRGDLVETVAEREAEAAMVLIGKGGEAADFAKGHLGSNLERVVQAARRPVFVAARAFRPIARVLLAYDGGPSARRVVDYVATSPLFAGLAVTLVTVGAETEHKALAGAAATLAAKGLAAETRGIAGDPATALGDLVEREKFDLVVTGAYGHSRIRSLIIGSTTTEMIRSCKAPLVLLR